MPHLDYKGPENLGAQTGRKLGKCQKNDNESKAIGELGKGRGERRHSGGGKDKRLKYNLKVYEMS